MLKNIISDTDKLSGQEFIQQQLTNLTPEQKQGVQQLINSGDIQAAYNYALPKFSQGIEQVTNANTNLQAQANTPLSLQDVLNDKKILTSGSNQRSLNQGLTTGVSGSLSQDAGVRRAMKMNSDVLRSQNTLSAGNRAINTSINQRLANQAGRIGDIQSMAGIGRTNVNAGLNANNYYQQMLQNKQAGGAFLQNVNQANNDIRYANANGQALWPWQQVANRTAVLNQVSPMAGYTTTNSQSGPSTAQQLAGLAGTAISAYGAMGGFNKGTDVNPVTGEYKNMWNNAGGTGLWNDIKSGAGTVAGWFGGGAS